MSSTELPVLIVGAGAAGTISNAGRSIAEAARLEGHIVRFWSS
jgi:hypothetical protein